MISCGDGNTVGRVQTCLTPHFHRYRHLGERAGTS
jgi:hypothetical protein